jgi:uncharacterized protein (UPF0218 family)
LTQRTAYSLKNLKQKKLGTTPSRLDKAEQEQMGFKDLKLPFEMRSDLKKPLGELIKGDVTENVVVLKKILEKQKPPCFATVGDYVTYYIIKFCLNPDLAVVDHRVMRQEVEPFKFRRNKVTVSNPAGTIKAETQRVLCEAITLKKKLGVVVEGEEDLLVLPLMAEANQLQKPPL